MSVEENQSLESGTEPHLDKLERTEQPEQMTELELTIADHLDKQGKRAITDDRRINYGILNIISDYIRVLELCSINTPTEQRLNKWGYTVININDKTQKQSELATLTNLWVIGLVDGTKITAKFVEVIEFRSNPCSKHPDYKIDISDVNNVYNSYVVTEQGRRLFEEHQKNKSQR